MIVQVKTLEGRLFKVEAAPEASIKAVKDIIETSQPELKAAMNQLHHGGLELGLARLDEVLDGFDVGFGRGLDLEEAALERFYLDDHRPRFL